jgi:uncharacterized protein
MSRAAHLLLLALGFISIGCNGLAQPIQQATSSGLAGTWEGTIDLAGTKLPIAVAFIESPTGLNATIDIQGAKGLPLQAVRRDGAKVHFELAAGLGLCTFESTFDGVAIKGTFTQGVTSAPFALARPGTVPPPPPAAPLPYRVEEVTFTNGPVRLAGTLTIPAGKGPFPAFVMVTGSGAQDRDENIYGFKVFGVIADDFTRRGIAVLRYDDRGVGGSTGSIAASTTEDFAGDALAGVALLETRPEIDHVHIGVFGHSEGADVAAIAAAHSQKVAFIVMMAGMARRGDIILRQQVEDSARALGGTDEQVARILAAHQKLVEAMGANAGAEALTQALRSLMQAQIEAQPGTVRAAIGDVNAYIDKALPAVVAQQQSAWMKYFVSFDPAPVLAQVTCPVLALFGERDTQVRPDLNRPALEGAFAKGGNSRVTVRVYPAANHLFASAATGQVSEYPTLEKKFVPGFLDDVSGWIRSVTR